MTFDSSPSYHKHISIYKQLRTQNHPGLLGPVSLEAKERQLGVTVFGEYVEMSLWQELGKRRDSGQHYSSLELMARFGQLAGALAHLHSQKMFSGRLNPQGVVVQQGVCRVVDHLLRGSIITRGEQLYCSPELLRSIEFERTQIELDPFAADIYSLAMIFLEMATLREQAGLF